MNSAKKLLTNTLLLTLSTIIMRSASMGFQVYISKKLGAEGIGLFELVMSIYGLGLTIGGMGIRVASTCIIAEEMGYGRPQGVQRAIRLCMIYGTIFGLIAAGATVIFAPLLSSAWIGDIRAVLPLKISGIVIPFSVLSSVMAGYFTASGKLGRYVVIEFFERGFSIVVTVFLFKLFEGRGIEYSCACIVGGSGISTALSLLVLYSAYKYDFLSSSDKVPPIGKRLVSLALPLGGNELARSGLNTLEHMLIPRGLKSYGQGEGQALASYGTIHGMVFPVITFPTAILYSLADILIPELSSCRAANMPNRVRYIVSHIMRLCMVFSALCCTLLFSVGNCLGELIYSSSETDIFFVMFSPLVIVMYMDTIVDGMLKGLGQQVYNVRLNTCTSVLDIALLLVLLPKYGINGYIAAFSITKVVNFLFSIARIVHISGYHPSGAIIVKLTVAIAFSASASVVVFHKYQPALLLTVALRGAFAVVLFTFFTFALGVLKSEDLNWLRKLVKKA